MPYGFMLVCKKLNLILTFTDVSLLLRAVSAQRPIEKDAHVKMIFAR